MIFHYLRAVEIGFVILVIALGAQWLLSHRAPAAWRVWLWRIALLQTTLALLPLAPIRLALLAPPPKQIVIADPATPAPATSIVIPPPPAVSAKEVTVPSAPSPIEPEVSAPTPATKTTQTVEVAPQPRFVLDWQRLLLTLYVLGIVAHFAWLCQSAFRVHRVLRTCSPIEEPQLVNQLCEVASSLKLRQPPRLLICRGGAPFLVGVLRPTIVLPSTYLNADEAQLEAVLAHELAHTIRRDLAWNAVLWLLGTTFWFHPLAWGARRFHSLEVESACDELVLQTTRISPYSYGELLLNAMNFHQSPLTAGVGDGFSVLKTRLSRLNRKPVTPSKFIRLAFVGALTLAFASLVPFRLVARAQSAPPSGAKQGGPEITIAGTVRDQNDQPVEGATVYYMGESGNQRLALNTSSDFMGNFRFSVPQLDPFGGYVIADAGQQGIKILSTHLERHLSALKLKVEPGVQAKVRLLDPQNRAVANLKVQLRHLWLNPGQPVLLPHPVWQRFNATTNAQGEATLPLLPAKMWATFQLGDSLNGDVPVEIAAKFAPLAPETYVALSPTAPIHTIHLLAPVRLTGRVLLGNSGKVASGDYVYAERIIGGGVGYKGSMALINSRGNYWIQGLRPGKYRVSVVVANWAKDWVSPVKQPTLSTPTTNLNFVLTHGALIDGVVAQKTGQPVKGMMIDLRDENGLGDMATTDAQGRFHFRASVGKQKMRIFNLPPQGLTLPRKGTYEFITHDGEKRSFRFELPIVAGARPITGQVVGPNGQPMVGATVSYRMVGRYNNSDLISTQCDSNGRFFIGLKRWPRPVQLFADAGDLTSPRSILATSGDNVNLQVKANTWASLEGRVVDEKGTPLPQTVLRFTKTLGYLGGDAAIFHPDSNGRYSFPHLRPGMGFSLSPSLAGHYAPSIGERNLAPGQQLKVDIVMRRPSTSLSGRLETAEGQPASGYQISAAGSERPVVTAEDGTFSLHQVLSGPINVWVSSPKEAGKTIYWSNLKARGGDENAVIRLPLSYSMMTSDKALPRPPQPASLEGQQAPEIRATRWSNNSPTPLSSLRGQVVFLLFTYAIDGFAPELSDLARSFSNRIKVVGVQCRFKNESASQQLLETNARRLGIPVALDTLQNGVSQTYSLYARRNYVVIGRTGKIAYSGNELDRAINVATSLSK